MPDNLKCAFCKWTTPRWITTKSGKKSSGMNRLLRHVEYAHEAKFDEIEEEEATKETGLERDYQ